MTMDSFSLCTFSGMDRLGSTKSTPSELFKLAKLTHRFGQHINQTRGMIYNSLSESFQDRLHDNLCC